MSQSPRPPLLFLSRWFPYPPHNGARLRVYNLLKTLAKQYRVDLLSFAEEEIHPADRKALRGICRRVDIVPYRPFHPGRGRALLGFLAPRPRFLVDTYQPEITRRMCALQARTRYALVLASELDMLPYLQQAGKTPTVLEELEISSQYDAWRNEPRALPRLRRRLTWWKLSGYLRRTLPRLHGCTVVSQVERARIQRAAPAAPPPEIVPNGVDTRLYGGDFGPPEADTLIYHGALTYHANFDAVDYFLREIFPQVRARRPRVRLRITGKTDGVPLARLPLGENVTLTGYLDDIRPAVARSWAAIIPLRVGGGTRLKILEALALGTPVVSTSKGAEGLDLQDGKHLLIADNPQAFAAAVTRLLSDPALREELGSRGREQVRRLYDWERIGARLNAYLQRILEARHAAQ